MVEMTIICIKIFVLITYTSFKSKCLSNKCYTILKLISQGLIICIVYYCFINTFWEIVPFDHVSFSTGTFYLGNPGTKIKEPGTSSSFVFLHLLPELQISCVFAFFTLWKRVKIHVLSDQSVHITHTYCCVSKLSKFGAYITIHFCLWEIPRNYFPLYFSKERAYTSEGYRMLTFLSIDVKRDLIGCLRQIIESRSILQINAVYVISKN
jgi:hypothetical protein